MFDVFTVKAETKKFVEEELSNISMPEMRGQEGRFQYTIKEYVYFIYCHAVMLHTLCPQTPAGWQHTEFDRKESQVVLRRRNKYLNIIYKNIGYKYLCKFNNSWTEELHSM